MEKSNQTRTLVLTRKPLEKTFHHFINSVFLTTLLSMSSIAAVLVTAFGSMAAHSASVSYNLTYNPYGGSDTSFDVTLYLDDTDYTGVGTETVVFTGVDVIFNGPFTGNVDILHSYTNTNTGPRTFPNGTGQSFVPFWTDFVNGNFTGFVRGMQPGPGAIGVANLWFTFNSIGYIAEAQFYGSAPTKYNTEIDKAKLDQANISGPNPVPVPAAVWLFSSGLIGLIGVAKRKKA